MVESIFLKLTETFWAAGGSCSFVRLLWESTTSLMKVLQKWPARLLYRAMECSRSVEAQADSAFANEKDNGYGIRATSFLRHGRARGTNVKDVIVAARSAQEQHVVHLVDAHSRSHKHATRSSFASETRAAVAGAGDLIPLAMALHEIAVGPLSVENA